MERDVTAANPVPPLPAHSPHIKNSGEPPTEIEPLNPGPTSVALAASPHSISNTPNLTDDQHKRVAALGLANDNSRPSLGQAYRDRRGLIWGEIRRIEGATEFNDGTSLKVTYEEAEKACKDGGNRLPTTADYEKLAADFGVRQGDGHNFFPSDAEFTSIVTDSQRGVPFPNGGYSPFFDNGETPVYPTLTFQRVWTSTPVPKEPGVYIFNSHYGLFQRWSRELKEPFLCVFDPTKEKGPRR